MNPLLQAPIALNDPRWGANMKRFIRLTAVLAALGPLSASPAAAQPLPAVGHVFIVILENKGFDETFGPSSPAAFLSQDLTQRGGFLRQYYATGHVSLDNYISLVSGQAPNSQTQSDCQIYTDFVGSPALDADGQAVGQGCVYPAIVQTVADQLQGAGLTWKGYMQDMGNSPTAPATCRHPTLNGQDDTQTAEVGDQYATRHNPFVYFHTIIDSPICDTNVVPLTDLPVDLQNLSTTPNYVFITPNLCEDGHDAPCVDNRPGGLVSADAFLEEWVPQILASPAYQQDGLLIVTFDEAEVGGSNPDASACCNEPTGPNTASPGIFGPGGGRTGAVLLSKFILPGSVNDTPYNHYSLLRSIEDLFGLGHLGYAGQSGLVPFGNDVYTACVPSALCTGTLVLSRVKLRVDTSTTIDNGTVSIRGVLDDSDAPGDLASTLLAGHATVDVQDSGAFHATFPLTNCAQGTSGRRIACRSAGTTAAFKTAAPGSLVYRVRLRRTGLTSGETGTAAPIGSVAVLIHQDAVDRGDRIGDVRPCTQDSATRLSCRDP